MEDDLVSNLRDMARAAIGSDEIKSDLVKDRAEWKAADEITRLTAELEQAREQLQEAQQAVHYAPDQQAAMILALRHDKEATEQQVTALVEALQAAKTGFVDPKWRLIAMQKVTEALSTLPDRAKKIQERIDEADRIILQLTMEHCSNPEYEKGFEMAGAYFHKYKESP